MAGNQPPHEGLGDDFLEQILAVQPGYAVASRGGNSGIVGGGGEMVGSTLPMIMGLQLGSCHFNTVTGLRNNTNSNSNNNTGHLGMLPLCLNLEDHSFIRQHDHVGGGSGLDGNNANTNNVSSSSATSGINDRDSLPMTSLFPAFGHLQIQAIRPSPPPPPGPPQLHQPFQAQTTPGAVSAVSHPLTIRPRVRARRGQATDPHSIAERLRRERIAERIKALQELVPSTANKTDRAMMLDEIVDYVKFLRLQVKVLSMSRLGAAGAVAQLVADIPMSSVEGDGIEGGSNQQPWEKWSNDGTEEQVAKLMEEDIGAAMQFLQSKALCIMPISLASAIFPTHQPDLQTFVKPESNAPS